MGIGFTKKTRAWTTKNVSLTTTIINSISGFRGTVPKLSTYALLNYRLQAF